MRSRLTLVVAVLVMTTALLSLSVAPAGAMTKSQLRSKALSLSNMPTGWSVDNASSSGGPGATSGCLAGVHKAPKNETKVSVAFANGQLPQLQEELATGPGGLAAYNRLNHVLAGCQHFTANDNGKSVTYTVGAMSFPQVGNQSSAYSVSFSVSRFNGALDFVLFRVGTIVGVLEYGDIGQPDTSQLQAFVTEAINKVEGKPTVTPTTF